jgi:hypothetical protein
MGVTTLVGGAYQIAASLEDTKTALVLGTYIPRTSNATMISSGTYDSTADTTNTRTINILTGLGNFKVGDRIYGATASSSGLVYSVSSDLKRITINGTDVTAALAGTGYTLSAAEVTGLISSGGTSGNATPVING